MKIPFFNEQTISEIIIQNLQKVLPGIKIILATTQKEEDRFFLEIAEKMGIGFFAGDENDVLKRFIKAAEQYDISNIIRVCGDNPFLSPELLKDLIPHFKEDTDYLSYKLTDNLPAIKSHIGMFAEIVSLKALKKVSNLTEDTTHHEHVTSYIYSHPDIFKVKFETAPENLFYRTDIRLTVDTSEDFSTIQSIYNAIYDEENRCKPNQILNYIDLHPSLKEGMKHRILNQKK